jgi:Zn-dependent peptidase ImmA (M78 family)
LAVSRATESKSAREMTEQRMRWLCEIFDYLNTEVEFTKRPLPTLDIPDDFNFLTGEDIERVATLVRKDWGLRSEPIQDMILALENMGIPVVTLAIPSDKQDGFCFRSSALDKWFVGVNVENASCSRARLDAAHELAHILLHQHVTLEQARNPASHKLLEQQAYRFAGALLFPRNAFIAEVNTVSLDYFCALKRKWGIAISAMIMRASDLGLIDAEWKSALYRGLTKRRWRGPLREPFDDEMTLERPRMLRRGFEAMLNSGMFARSAILSALPQPPPQIEEIANLDAGMLTGARVTDCIAATLRREQTNKEERGSEGKVLKFPGRGSF